MTALSVIPRHDVPRNPSTSFGVPYRKDPLKQDVAPTMNDPVNVITTQSGSEGSPWGFLGVSSLRSGRFGMTRRCLGMTPVGVADGDLVRLQKVIAASGLASRRKAEQLILEGRVQVNGEVVRELGVKVNPFCDKIFVDGHPLPEPAPKVYLMLNKPRFCVTTRRDPQGRPTVMDFVGEFRDRVFPVGRLDFDAEGLLLLTNDGVLTNRLIHPRFGVKKEYLVLVKGHPGKWVLNKWREGVYLEEGKTAPAEVEVVKRERTRTWLRVVLHQGWYRQIKRMGQVTGCPVFRIKRIGYGSLKLGDLAPGEFRHLTPEEVRLLYEDAGL
jgi:23S rRNA pseudouridine2605 synthase